MKILLFKSVLINTHSNNDYWVQQQKLQSLIIWNIAEQYNFATTERKKEKLKGTFFLLLLPFFHFILLHSLEDIMSMP